MGYVDKYGPDKGMQEYEKYLDQKQAAEKAAQEAAKPECTFFQNLIGATADCRSKFSRGGK